MVKVNRKIVIRDFFGKSQHLYEDLLGFRESNKREARTINDHEIFNYYICLVRLQMVFYHVDTHKYYSISTMASPIKIKILQCHADWSDHIYYQSEHDADEEAEVIATFEKAEDIWDNLKIEGKSLEEVLRRSFITALN